MKNGYLILNTGTPDEPTIPALRRYLKEFLSDPDMLDYPSIKPQDRAFGLDTIKNKLASKFSKLKKEVAQILTKINKKNI